MLRRAHAVSRGACPSRFSSASSTPSTARGRDDPDLPDDHEINHDACCRKGKGPIDEIRRNAGNDVRIREAHVIEWQAGMIAKVTVYTDVDQARSAAERLAESTR
jgi:hypothetical protein